MRSVLLLLVSAAVVMVPGVTLGWLLRMRGVLLVFVAPALTFALYGAAGTWLRRVGIPWSALTAFVVLAVALPCAWLLSRWLARRSPAEEPEPRHGDRAPAPARGAVLELPAPTSLWAYLGPALGSLIGLAVVGRALGWTLSTVNQSWDPPYHANLVSYIASTGLGDWSATRYLQLGWSGQFYPTGMHVVQVVVLQITGQDASRVFNAFMVLSVVLLPWPLFVLARVIAPGRAVAAAAVGLIANVLPFQPWVQVGTQPWTWSMSLMPACVALGVRAAARRDWIGVPAAALALSGLLALQPAGLASGLVVLVCWVVAGPIGWRARSAAAVRLVTMLAIVAVLLAPFLYAGSRAVGTVLGYFSQPGQPLGAALAETVLLYYPHVTQEQGVGPEVAVVAFTVVGLVWCLWVRRLRWVALAYAATIALDVVSRSAPPGIRARVTGLWYSDIARLDRFQEAATVLVAGLGVAALVALAARTDTRRLRVAATAVLPLVLLGGLLAQSNVLSVDESLTAFEYGEHPNGPTITAQQVDVLKSHAQLFGPHDVVVVDSWQGGIWLHALTGVRAASAVYGDPTTYDADLLLRHVGEIDTNEQVRQVVVKDHVCGVYVGTGAVVKKDWTWPGFAHLDDAAAFRLAYADANSKIYVLQGPLAAKAGCRSAQGTSTGAAQ